MTPACAWKLPDTNSRQLRLVTYRCICDSVLPPYIVGINAHFCCGDSADARIVLMIRCPNGECKRTVRPLVIESLVKNMPDNICSVSRLSSCSLCGAPRTGLLAHQELRSFAEMADPAGAHSPLQREFVAHTVCYGCMKQLAPVVLYGQRDLKGVERSVSSPTKGRLEAQIGSAVRSRQAQSRRRA